MADPVAVTFLGGLSQIGRNCAVIETSGRRVLLDCGRMFAGDELPGVDSVLPDFSWLVASGGVEACVATHAHEDHIGALPYLLQHMSFPVYGSAFTLALVRHKLAEAGMLDRAELREVHDGERYRAGPFEVEALPVTHSTPGGLINAFYTPQGVILHSSDFKLDLTPVDGRRTALSRIGAIAHDPGVRLLLADSTNADTPGSTSSETEIGAVLADLIAAQKGRRVIVSAFASHIHRIQQVIDAAHASGRMVATLGRSMQRNVTLARELGLLHVPDHALVDVEYINAVDGDRVLIVCTGSQGEPLAALTQMALGNSKWVDVDSNDTVIFSSHPIPGNEAAVARVRSGLCLRGARVVHSGQLQVHTSGHASQQELMVLHLAASPEWFVPVHGEYEHLVAHGRLARRMGMRPDRVLVCVDGDRLDLSDSGIERTEFAGGDHVYVDGSAGALGAVVLEDRRRLNRAGFVVVTVVVDLEERRVVGAPDVKSKGWVEKPELADCESTVGKAVAASVASMVASGASRASIEDIVMRTARRSTRVQTKRKPMIIPVVCDVSAPRQ